jgi:hypothetical protein
VAGTPAEFEREHGCTEVEWLRSLPGAVGAHHLTLPTPGRAEVALQGGGQLTVEWSVLPERQIALIRLPRMQVRYAFSPEVAGDARASFMMLFDLHMRRGGG